MYGELSRSDAVVFVPSRNRPIVLRWAFAFCELQFPISASALALIFHCVPVITVAFEIIPFESKALMSLAHTLSSGDSMLSNGIISLAGSILGTALTLLCCFARKLELLQ